MVTSVERSGIAEGAGADMLQTCVLPCVAPVQRAALVTRPAPRNVNNQWRPAATATSSSRRRLRWRNSRLPAAAGEAPPAELTLEQLQAGLEEAVKAEDYASAAKIRDRINVSGCSTKCMWESVRVMHCCLCAGLPRFLLLVHVQAHPITVTKAELEAAVQEERFQVGAAGLQQYLVMLAHRTVPVLSVHGRCMACCVHASGKPLNGQTAGVSACQHIALADNGAQPLCPLADCRMPHGCVTACVNCSLRRRRHRRRHRQCRGRPLLTPPPPPPASA